MLAFKRARARMSGHADLRRLFEVEGDDSCGAFGTLCPLVLTLPAANAKARVYCLARQLQLNSSPCRGSHGIGGSLGSWRSRSLAVAFHSSFRQHVSRWARALAWAPRRTGRSTRRGTSSHCELACTRSMFWRVQKPEWSTLRLAIKARCRRPNPRRVCTAHTWSS